MGKGDNWTCSTCAETAGTKRYCAPTRCYCGHSTCHAFDSWVDLRARRATTPAEAKPKPGRSAWDTREESTWIDSL